MLEDIIFKLVPGLQESERSFLSLYLYFLQLFLNSTTAGPFEFFSFTCSPHVWFASHVPHYKHTLFASLLILSIKHFFFLQLFLFTLFLIIFRSGSFETVA